MPSTLPMPSTFKGALRAATLLLLSLFFAAAGVAHFTMTDDFAQIVPPFLPFPELIVQITGAMELVFALGLLWPKWRARTGWALSVFLLCVLPANIYMALEGMPLGDFATSKFSLWVRVGLQFPLITLILWSARSLERKRGRGS